MTAPFHHLFSRRAMLRRASHGFGWLAFAGLMAERQARAARNEALAPRPASFRPRAKRVVLLFMDGGVSQVDSFDPKPRLQAESGQPFKMKIETTQFENNGSTMGSPFEFRRHGRSGIPVSSLFPKIATCADDLCVIRSMKSDFAEHSQSCFMLHTGHPLAGRPSMGSWVSYGLGTESENLPGFVVLNGGQIPLGGLANVGSGFLPASHEASLFHVGAKSPVVDNIVPADAGAELQFGKLGFVAEADRAFLDDAGSGGAQIEAAIRNYELAFAMQSSVPEAADLRGESEATRKLYGLDSGNPLLVRYATECLLARRLLERGVRFVELTCVAGLRNVAPWDSHANLKEEHAKNAAVVDQPIAALIHDLKARGLLEDTLIIWAGEFGRTPFAQGSQGRDHNPQGFTIWLAGGGARPGFIHGATDEYGYHAVENVMSFHDLQATILHLLGFDHERLTFRHAGRDFRLTDVHGNVVRELLA